MLKSLISIKVRVNAGEVERFYTTVADVMPAQVTAQHGLSVLMPSQEVCYSNSEEMKLNVFIYIHNRTIILTKVKDL